jgi:pimeloyl-ACP methyl ester carboxylesterase
MQQHGHVQAWLLGHSGGGTLAVLLAARMPPGTITRVVTVGANLDVAAWSSHHGYSPLSGSLDPAREPPLPANVEVVHFVGGRDVVVPPETLDGYRRQHPEARFEGMREYDHTCCWEEAWAALLQGLEAKPARALPPR